MYTYAVPSRGRSVLGGFRPAGETYQITLGGGDPPEHTTKALLGYVVGAAALAGAAGFLLGRMAR
jgi:hypothetical protein